MYAQHNPGLGDPCTECGGQTFFVQETGYDEYYQCLACGREAGMTAIIIPIEVGKLPLARRNKAIDRLQGIREPPDRTKRRRRRKVGAGE